MSSFCVIDFIFFGVAFIFMLTAFMRGFVREVFALLNWVVAITMSHLLAPYASKLIMFYTKNTVVADITSRTILFILFFIITMLLTGDLSKNLKEKIPLVFDRSLGIFFGLIKTLLVFGLLYSAMMNIGSFVTGKNKEFTPGAFKAPWLVDAQTYKIIRFSGGVVDPVVKLFLDSIIKNFEQTLPKSHLMDSEPKTLDSKIDEVVDEKIKEEVSSKIKSAPTTDADKGYSKKDIQKMDHLIDIVK